MRIEIVTVPDCPHRVTAMRRVRAAVDRTGLDAVVVEQVNDDPATAAAVGMAGSPTILVDGRDVFRTPASEPSISRFASSTRWGGLSPSRVAWVGVAG